MTLLIASIYGSSEAELRRHVAAAVEQGADAVELRLDLCDGVTNDQVRSLIEGARLAPFILTIRSAAEGGAWDGTDDDRVSRLIELGPGVDLIDVELDLWRRSANVRQKISLALNRAPSETKARQLLLSKHDPFTRPASLHKDFLEMVAASECAVPKIAFRARTIRDNFEAFDLMRGSPKKSIVICMGPDGAPSRILARKFGAFATFASSSEDRATAPGQLSIQDLKQTYRWDDVNPATSLYGLVGNPVLHSLSPRMHNRAFMSAGVDAVYVPFRVDDSYESFKAFMVEVIDRPWLDLRGLSITLPHKEHALRFALEYGGEVDDPDRRIGSVNTFRLENAGRLSAFNTDAPALLDEICSLINVDEAGLRGKTAAILGAGGMARSAARILADAGMVVTLYNRTDDRARQLAESAGCGWRPWPDRIADQSWLLINCTSSGLSPDESPLPETALNHHEYLFDSVYRHGETRLVREARKSGVIATSGVGLLVRQAARQFRIWTGREVSLEFLRQAVNETLQGPSSSEKPF